MSMLVALSGCRDANEGQEPRSHTPHVVYIVAAESDADVRGDEDYRRFVLEAKRVAGLDDGKVTFEFVKSVGHGRAPVILAARKVVERTPAVIVATSYDVVEAVKAETASIPILFLSHPDPVGLGYVKAIAAPGVRRTGFTYYIPLIAKQLEVLRDAFPNVRHIGVVADDFMMHEKAFQSEIESARERLPIIVRVFLVTSPPELARLAVDAEAREIDAWFIPISDAIGSGFADAVSAMARTGKPVIYTRSAAVQAGGSLAYQANFDQASDIWARQLKLILDGVDPATIPVERPDRFEMAMNVKAAERDPALRPSKAIILRSTRFFDAQ